MSEVFGSIWWLLVTLGVLVTFHEFGHFWVARRFGVRVLRFSVGFGRPLWRRVARDGTEYVIAAIPLGGYVKFLDSRETDVEPFERAGDFIAKPVWQRMAIVVAGPLFNLLFAVFAFWLMFLVGRPDYQPVIGVPTALAAEAGLRDNDRLVSVSGEAVDSWSRAVGLLAEAAIGRRDAPIVVARSDGSTDTRTLPLSRIPAGIAEKDVFQQVGLSLKPPIVPAVIDMVEKKGPAHAAGLRTGDRITRINGTEVTGFGDVVRLIGAGATADPQLQIEVERDGSRLTVPVKAVGEAQADGKTRWRVGIGGPDAHNALLRYGPLAAIPAAFAETWSTTKQSLRLIKMMVVGQAELKNISGVISIAQFANSSAQLGVAWFLGFLALISLSLCIMNLLPIPILDGGHLVYYLIESIKGSPVSERAMLAGQYAGLLLLAALMGLAFYNDILRLANP
jgi:regulator of sigma E protease